MATGRSFRDLKGGIDLADKMVVTQWKGMLVARSYPTEHSPSTPLQAKRHRSLSGFSPLWSKALDDVERAEWEAMAKDIGSAYLQEKRMTTGKSVIANNPGGVLMSGHDLFLRCNMLAETSGFTCPRLKAPLPSGLPPSPGLLAYLVTLPNGKQAILCRLKPPVTHIPNDIVYRLWTITRLRSKYVAYERLLAIVKVGSGLPSLEGVTVRERQLFHQAAPTLSQQERQILDAYENEKGLHTDGIILNGFSVDKKYWGMDWLSFSDLDLGVVRLQAEVVMADSPEHGALRSAPSNLEEVYLPEQPTNTEAQRLVSMVRQRRKEADARRRIKNNIVKRFFLQAAEKVLKGETTEKEIVDKTING